MRLLELPHFLEELLPAEVVPGLPGLYEELFLSDSLGGDSGMIRPGEEEGLIAVHAFIPDECIFNGDCEGVSDV